MTVCALSAGRALECEDQDHARNKNKLASCNSGLEEVFLQSNLPLPQQKRFQRNVWRYARTLCTDSSVYFPSCSLCASSGLSTLNFTALLNHERYQPAPSTRPITNSSRYASLPVTVSPEGNVTVTVAGEDAG